MTLLHVDDERILKGCFVVAGMLWKDYGDALKI